MKVVRCPNGGFCEGVSRAVRMALGAKQSGWTVYTDGDLVHSKAVARLLQSHDIYPWDGKERQWQKNECLLIRAHGISAERRAFLQQLGCRLLDATCPHVDRIAGKILQLRQRGHRIILFGDKNHPEVVGLKSYGGDRMHVLSSADEIAAIPLDDREPIILSQTTARVEDFQKFVAAVLHRFPNGRIFDSICAATRLRQRELEEHIRRRRYDGAVVVGSVHSSNSRKLAEKLRDAGISSILVENLDDLRGRPLPEDGTLLLTAGTSTPPEEIDAIESYLRSV